MLSPILRVSAIATIFTTLFLASPTIAKQNDDLEAYYINASISDTQKNKIITYIKAKKDDRAARLRNYLASQGSPMADNAEDMVRIADTYDYDWKLLPSIAGVESQFGKIVPFGSYNPYGWYNGNFSFTNWNHATEYVAKEMKTKWGYMGRINHWKIASSYAASPFWAGHVEIYMRQIDKYSN